MFQGLESRLRPVKSEIVEMVDIIVIVLSRGLPAAREVQHVMAAGRVPAFWSQAAMR